MQKKTSFVFDFMPYGNSDIVQSETYAITLVFPM